MVEKYTPPDRVSILHHASDRELDLPPGDGEVELRSREVDTP